MCVVSETSDAVSASNPLRRCGRAQGRSSRKVAGRLIVYYCTPLYMHSNLVCIESVTSGTKCVKKMKRYPSESTYLPFITCG